MKRILVALDGSSRAPAVLETARKLAEAMDAKLVLFRAVGIPPELPRDILQQTNRRLEDVLIDDASAALKTLANAIPPDRIEACSAQLATAWDGICRAAKDHAVDLIVIGSHGYGAIDRVLGTTAAKVVNHADRNVLVVRSPASKA